MRNAIITTSLLINPLPETACDTSCALCTKTVCLTCEANRVSNASATFTCICPSNFDGSNVAIDYYASDPTNTTGEASYYCFSKPRPY